MHKLKNGTTIEIKKVVRDSNNWGISVDTFLDNIQHHLPGWSLEKQITIRTSDGSTVMLDSLEVEVIRMFYRANQKVRGIKYARWLYNLGLKEAKDLCDDIGELTGSREDPFSNLK